MKVTCATCSTELSEEFPVCDEHPQGRLIVEGVSGLSVCLVCSNYFTRRNPLDKSERRCVKCSQDKECEGNQHFMGAAEKRQIKAKFKTMFPKAPPVASRFLEVDDESNSEGSE